MRWLLGKLALFLLDKIQQWLDPEYTQRLNDYKRRAETQQKAVEQAEIELGAIDSKLSQVNAAKAEAQEELAQRERQLETINQQILEVKNETTKTLDDIANLSDSNVLRADFGNKSKNN